MPASEYITELNSVINHYGQILRFKYFSVSGANVGYDDNVTLTQSGENVWESGLVQPIKATQSSMDAVLMAQGRIANNDLKIYINGNIQTSGVFKVGLGSPPTEEYSIIDEGINHSPQINGSSVYKLMYVRRLTNGSIINEV